MHLKAVLAVLCLSALLARSNAQLNLAREVLDDLKPKILLEDYQNVPSEEGYKFSYRTSDGANREEEGIRMNPGTDQEELVVMGAYEYEDDGIQTVTMYTADKNGYRPRVSIKNRKLDPKLMASLAGEKTS